MRSALYACVTICVWVRVRARRGAWSKRARILLLHWCAWSLQKFHGARRLVVFVSGCIGAVSRACWWQCWWIVYDVTYRVNTPGFLRCSTLLVCSWFARLLQDDSCAHRHLADESFNTKGLFLHYIYLWCLPNYQHSFKVGTGWFIYFSLLPLNNEAIK